MKKAPNIRIRKKPQSRGFYQLGALGLLLLSWFAYLLPDTVTLEDGGEMILVAHTAGIPHAPGYPLFALAGGLFSRLPTGNPAWNIHFLSAVFGVLTLIMLFRVIEHWTRSRPAAWFGVALTALAPTLVHFFTVAEVYSLFTFCFVSCLYFVLTEKKARWIFLFAGLGLSAHWPLFVFAAPALLLLRPRLAFEITPKTAALFLAGLAPYFYLFMVGAEDAFLANGPMDSLQKFWRVIAMRDVYFSKLGSWSDPLRLFLDSLLTMVKEGPLLFAVAGLVVACWERRFRLLGSLFYLTIGMVFALHLTAGLSYDILVIDTTRHFFVFNLLACGAAAALAAEAALRRSFRVAAPAMALTLAGLVAMQWRDYDFHREGRFAEGAGNVYLKALPPKALMLVHGVEFGAMSYLHHIQSIRPDVKLQVQYGFQFDGRGTDKDYVDPDRVAKVVVDHLSAGGPVFAFRLTKEIRATLAQRGLLFLDHGLFTEIAAGERFTGLAPGAVETVRAFADRFAELKLSHWRYIQESLVGPMCKYLTVQNVGHVLLDSTVYCRYYRLKSSPPGYVLAAEEGRRLLEDVALFPADERATIAELVNARMSAE